MDAARTGASGYHHHGPDQGQPERRSPDRQERARRAQRAELEFGRSGGGIQMPDAPRAHARRTKVLHQVDYPADC